MQGFMAGDGEIQAHEETYSGFMAMLKWGTVICFVVAIGVIFLIAN